MRPDKLDFRLRPYLEIPRGSGYYNCIAFSKSDRLCAVRLHHSASVQTNQNLHRPHARLVGGRERLLPFQGEFLDYKVRCCDQFFAEKAIACSLGSRAHHLPRSNDFLHRGQPFFKMQLAGTATHRLVRAGDAWRIRMKRVDLLDAGEPLPAIQLLP